MSSDSRQLTVVQARRMPDAGWALSIKTSEPLADGLYLMIPIDDIPQSAQIVYDLGVGMANRRQQSQSDGPGESNA